MSRLPQVKAGELVKFLKHLGFEEDRQKGSHLTLVHPERPIPITVPVHTGEDIGRGLLARTLKDAGSSAAEFIRWRS